MLLMCVQRLDRVKELLIGGITREESISSS